MEGIAKCFNSKIKGDGKYSGHYIAGARRSKGMDLFVGEELKHEMCAFLVKQIKKRKN